MNNISLLYCTFLCVIFFIINLKKIGLKNKTVILPSTFFALFWGISSLGVFLFSNDLISNTDYYIYAEHLENIGHYQLQILCTIFTAFAVVRFKCSNVTISIPHNFGYIDVPLFRQKIKWLLYLFFVVGLFRLIMVISIIGFNYALMRSSYVEGRAFFNSFDFNLIRLGSYLLQFAQLYVCLLGIESAMRGLNYKTIIINFLLFCPFQMSFGGRLFILSFFMPFFFSFFVMLYSTQNTKEYRRQQFLKVRNIFLLAVFLIIFFQMLKMGVSLNMNGFYDFISEIFYTSSSYRHMNEFWDYINNDYNLEYGKNILGVGKTYKDIYEYWNTTRNSALVCVPSMIPGVFLDFGYHWSLVFYFILFYNVEKYAILCLSKANLKGFLTFVILCIAAYQTTATSISDILKGLIVAYIAIYFVCKLVKKVKIK